MRRIPLPLAAIAVILLASIMSLIVVIGRESYTPKKVSLMQGNYQWTVLSDNQYVTWNVDQEYTIDGGSISYKGHDYNPSDIVEYQGRQYEINRVYSDQLRVYSYPSNP